MKGDIAMAESIDEGLYSRQIYVLGHDAMYAMQSATILISGLAGVGVEIAKNVILAGVKSVILVDDTIVSEYDLAAGYYFSESDIGTMSRVDAALPHLASLNRYVHVISQKGPITLETLASNFVAVLVWAVDHPIESETVMANEIAFNAGVKFVQADVFGVCGMVFVDNGDSFDVRDTNGEPPLEGLISHISKEPEAVVTLFDETRHGLSNGDQVVFSDIEGMTELNNVPCKVAVLGPYSFRIDHDTTNYNLYKNAGTFRQVKSSFSMKFRRLRDCLEKPTIALMDFGKEQAALQVHLLHRSLSTFRVAEGRGPRYQTWEDADAIVQSVVTFGSVRSIPVDVKMLRNMARCAEHALSPICATIGGIAAQEVIKACTGKFTPLHQHLYFDCIEVLPDDIPNFHDFEEMEDSRSSRYRSQIAVVGRQVQEQLASSTTFLIGAGAIGCEILKNWAMMGVATKSGTKVFITDMDTIERSNLNRQFLFRNTDVGLLKSETAAAAVKSMNPQVNIVSQSNRLGPDTEGIYNDDFWDSLTVVCTALDNVDARLYADQRCVYYNKPLMESGTMGAKGNTQIVVPHLTESYGATRDPPEKSIPLCTLKNFPSQIEHTIQWSRDIFEGWFKAAAETVNRYLSDPEFLTSLRKDNPNAVLETLRVLESCLCSGRPLSFEDCIAWARLQFEVEFSNNIKQLLSTFPPDSTTSSGTPFWSGPKRAPTPLVFDIEDPTHMSFINAAASLRAFNYGLNGHGHPSISDTLKNVTVPRFVPSENIRIAASDEEMKTMDSEANGISSEVEVERIISHLPHSSKLAGYRLTAVEFEKDCDENFHVAFITACSNLRARNYRIAEATAHDTKRIAGKIIPAIATTTALVAGLICLELYKLVQKKGIKQYRNCFVNLALPLFSIAEPVPPLINESCIGEKGSQVLKWTQWDRIDISLGNCRLCELIAHLKEQYSVDIEMLSFGPSLLFAFFSPSRVREARLQLQLSDLVFTVGKYAIPSTQKYIVLEACLTNSAGDDVDFPYLRVNLH